MYVEITKDSSYTRHGKPDRGQTITLRTNYLLCLYSSRSTTEILMADQDN